MKIIVCSIGINDWYIDIVKYSFRNIETYCNIHNYKHIIHKTDGNDYDFIYDKKRAPPWYKIKLLKHILETEDCDYVFWIDADCQILSLSVKLEYFIDKYFKSDNIHLALTQEDDLINTGIMFLKKSKENISLLERIWDVKDKHFELFHEQSALINLYRNDKKIRDMTYIIPYGEQKDELVVYWGNYNPAKNFIIHLAGCHDKLSLTYMMDMFYINKLDEETCEEYKDRINWLMDEKKCRSDIQKWIKKEYCPIKYSIRYYIHKNFLQPLNK